MVYVISGGALLAMCAFMAHGDEGSWFENTLKALGMLVLVVGAILLISWVMTGPGDSMWGNGDN